MITLALVSAVTTSSIAFFRKTAPKLGLIDSPNERKLHTGAIPLVGGISICIALLIRELFYPSLPNSEVFVLAIASLTTLGALDDRFDVSFKIRLVFQAVLSLAMARFAELKLSHLGDMFGFGVVDIGAWGYLVTILAVIGAINAYNMLDGSDGLIGTVAMPTFLVLALGFYSAWHVSLALFCLGIVAAIIPFLFFNIGLAGPRRKIFMGDAGSMLIGFVVIWLLLLASQPGEHQVIQPAVALWFISVPLMDMVRVMVTRVVNGKSPFHPDRTHLHHLLQQLGFGKKRIVLTMFSMALAGCCIGLYASIIGVPEYVLFYGFIAFFVTYCIATRLIKLKLARNEFSALCSQTNC